MTPLDVTLDLDRRPWHDLAERAHPMHADGTTAKIVRVGLLRNGTDEGRACVELAIELPPGEIIFAETTLRLARMAATLVAASPLFAEETP